VNNLINKNARFKMVFVLILKPIARIAAEILFVVFLNHEKIEVKSRK